MDQHVLRRQSPSPEPLHDALYLRLSARDHIQSCAGNDVCRYPWREISDAALDERTGSYDRTAPQPTAQCELLRGRITTDVLHIITDFAAQALLTWPDRQR